MNEKQRIHIAMMNSYNTLTNKARIVEIVESALPIFGHVIDKPLRAVDLEFVQKYFESIEEYEKCIELAFVYMELFDDNGKMKKIETCDCDMPGMPKYDDKMKCTICDKYIVYEQYYE
jgi:hypothetical protein